MFLKKCGNNKRGIFFPQFGFQKLVMKSEGFIDLLEEENGGKGGNGIRAGGNALYSSELSFTAHFGFLIKKNHNSCLHAKLREKSIKTKSEGPPPLPLYGNVGFPLFKKEKLQLFIGD